MVKVSKRKLEGNRRRSGLDKGMGWDWGRGRGKVEG